MTQAQAPTTPAPYTCTPSRQMPEHGWYWIHREGQLPASGDLCRGAAEARARVERLNRKLKGHQR